MDKPIKKLSFILVTVCLLIACSATNDRVNEKFDVLKYKADQLDSIINAEAARVQQLDTIIYREIRKVQQLDSIIAQEKRKWLPN